MFTKLFKVQPNEIILRDFFPPDTLVIKTLKHHLLMLAF